MLKKVAIVLYLFLLKIKQVFPKKKGQKHILIIKTDAIGDYIIFRNFLMEIANHYKGYKITFLGNILLKDLAAELDQSIIHNFIYVNHKTLNADWFKLLKEIAIKNYELTINFHYSRTFIGDVFSYASNAKKKIAMDGDDLNMNQHLREMFNQMYDVLIKTPPSIINEFARLKFFTEQIINDEITFTQPYLKLSDKKFAEIIPTEEFIVFAPGAAVKNRQLEISKLGDIVRFVLKTNTICFIGSPDECAMVEEIKANIPHHQLSKIIDLTGKTPLTALPFILNEALAIICNDSGIFHIAAALKKTTLCLTGGGHFERFLGYPVQKNVRFCYKSMPCFNCEWKCIYKFPLSDPYPCINAIELQSVYQNFSFLENEYIKYGKESTNNKNTIS
ncbi:MAG: glycosyltransferase family 9 protein [Bacteroidota bacterium]|nr:glycosyltransferase family 9 protein [Bacteroidota bacterium]